MSIPPFPTQDLAKLVLGYLAEEQLMTAYDEFLQASPYLDALRNEYDRIFMTSLKSILAEYRAVKIYVDTCKPFVLRKKIFQCSNLLDVVKFLVTNVDINKIQLQEASEKASLEKLNITITPKPNVCEVCHSAKHAYCVCKSRQTDVQQPENVSASHVEASSLQNSVEATALGDLPGNHVTTRKKQVKALEKDCMLLDSNDTRAQNSDSSAKQSFSSIISPEEYLASCEDSTNLRSSDNNSCLSLNSTVKLTEPSKSKQSIEEFNNVLKSVVNRNKTLSSLECPPNQRISNASTFQEFASGVSSGESKSATYNIPDSSTSENINVRPLITKDQYIDNMKGPPQQLLLEVSHVNNNIEIQSCSGDVPSTLKPSKSAKLAKILPKVIDPKIKIISDVKVGSQYSDTNNDNVKRKPIVPLKGTSTPLMHMQTIMINGMPAYKHSTPKFTKDEIMAMPTLIIVPASGSSQIPTSAHCESIMTQNSNVISQASSSSSVLEPLVIDVPALPNKQIVSDLPDLSEHKPLESGLVKTVDIKNASVPKDNVISVETNTPQVLPATRKSSSTPRRSSHIRVLDFATPRRILQETINEQVSSQSSDPPVEIVLSSSPNLASTQTPSENVITKSDVTVVNEEGINNDSGSAKENDTTKSVKANKYDWDADLRALIANDKAVLQAVESETKRKPRPKTSKKIKSADIIADNDKTENKKKTRNKKSPKNRKTKIRRKIEKYKPPANLDTNYDIPCKPTINIICGNNNEKIDVQVIKNETENIQNKSNDKEEEYINTPESERLSLQNVIGEKLNISDLLETPYKQALYDIQMETPKFLGPDLPGEPLSDIKIMNIPTPRFLNDTPKPVEATPSSYSSRLTDYSSGGSYYKPDEQDYILYSDLITCPVTSSKEDLSIEKSTEKESDNKKSRPVRQCTKNVSYYKNSIVANKTKDLEENVEAASCADTISINSSFEFQDKTEVIPKTPRDKCQSPIKTETKKRNSTSRKRKSPKDFSVRDKIKPFIKIKPRYTPKKETPSGRIRNRNIQSQHYRESPSLQERKRTTSKEKLGNATPVVAVPTKSRRKSSTPRKLQCTKTFNSESSGHDSPEITSNTKPNANREKTNSNTQDSDTEQLALRWSDDGSQDGKTKDIPPNKMGNEIEDITKIKEFIVSSDIMTKRVRPNDDSVQENLNKHVRIENDGTLQRDLIKRGFDLETAKIIERDLLDETPLSTETNANRTVPISVEIFETKKDDSSLEKTFETDNSIANELQIVHDEMIDDDDDSVLSGQDCNEESKNYFVFEHDDAKEIIQGPTITLKHDYTMEFCFSDVSNIRLKLTPYISTVDERPVTVDETGYSYKETEQAVSSISNIDRLYTPFKDSLEAQCYEIFDSTLTSIDTPIKAKSPPRTVCEPVKELVVVGEKEAKDKTGAKKRKRLKSAEEATTSNKRTKPDADLLLKTANIQNIDIETVLTKLHGH